ncbi:MAG: hypothetical protein R3F03_09550 [Opitutaceae bacterium]
MQSITKCRAPLLAALVVAGVALGFALATNHTWEDYYITFRSSKNLATGHGLVFNIGDRLHTFTSPLGALLPALSYLLTANSSDAGALWIFRLMSCAALGGAAALLWMIARQRKFALIPALFLIAGLATEAKTVDFTINGMETGFMILFLTYAIWAHITPAKRQWAHLGGAWAGLMWTRPDSFIYIGLVAAGFWLFNDQAESKHSRKELFLLCLRAGLLTTALYLPWLLIAWGYYGTPVPHTITAKSGIGDPRTLAGVIQTVLQLPFSTNPGGNTLADAFLPSYYMIGGWPAELTAYARTLGTVCALLWLFPLLRATVRAASFAFFGAHVYLTYFPYFAFPWYLPPTTLLALVTLAALLNQLNDFAAGSIDSARRSLHRTLALTAAGIIFVSAFVTWESGRAFAAQQRLIEDGNRRIIGEWLHVHAATGDTIFLEPLGYIGYFSGLKTFDFPGMSSRESVEARQAVGNDWADLIRYLRPTWLVLRPAEIARLNAREPSLLNWFYAEAQSFDVREQVSELDVRGLPYLLHDAAFIVFRNVRPIEDRNLNIEFDGPYPVSHQVIGNFGVSLVHAPGSMTVDIPDGVRRLKVMFGFPSAAYEGTEPSDGAVFIIEWKLGDEAVQLMERTLRPATQPYDRGLQSFEAVIPAREGEGAKLVFRTTNLESRNKDWTCWTQPEFR